MSLWWGALKPVCFSATMEHVDYTCASYRKEVHVQKDTCFYLFLTVTSKKKT